MTFVRLITATFLFFVSAHHANAVLFSTRYVEGSTCLHHMDTGLPFRFDMGQAAEMVMRSIAVQVTRRGVRFISPLQHIRPGGIKGWEEFECVHASNELGTTTGSMCSIRVNGSIPANSTSMNEVLPCAGAFSQGFTPRCSKDTSVSPEGMQRLLESVPSSIRGCKGFGGTAGARYFLSHSPDHSRCLVVSFCTLHTLACN